MSSPISEEELREKVRKQCSIVRTRIKDLVCDVMQEKFNSTAPYKPKKVVDPNNSDWLKLWNNQTRLVERINAAKDAIDGGLAKEELIFGLRKDFPELAKKYPAPERKAPPTPAPTPAAAPSTVKPVYPMPTMPPGNKTNPANTTNCPPPSGTKRKQYDDMDDDEDDEETLEAHSEYDPEEDTRAQREERAAKRQRAAGETTTTTPRERKQAAPIADEDDLNYQLEEIQMKADLAKLQLKRKWAAEKKKADKLKIKKEGA